MTWQLDLRTQRLRYLAQTCPKSYMKYEGEEWEKRWPTKDRTQGDKGVTVSEKTDTIIRY